MKADEIKQAFDLLNAKYAHALEKLKEAYELLDKQPDRVQTPATGDLSEAARLMAQSEMNKEDLSEEEILDMLQKLSEEEVRGKMGFWAMPLPVDDDEDSTNLKYTGKPR